MTHHISARAGLAALTFALTLSACSSDSEEGSVGMAGQMIYGIVERLIDPEATPRPPAKIERKMAADLPYASIGVKIDDNPQFLFLMANQADKNELYTLGYQISIVMRGGRVIRTQGLSRDVLGARWDGEDIIKTAVHSGSPVQGVRWFDSNERGIRTLEARCVAQAIGDETITILETPIVTRHIQETCQVEELQWRYVNDFWIAPDTLQTWASIQYISPKVNPLILETFRPAS
ncbi:MAG: YjbF family lipoprotein [Micropepsaceae bacterium]